LKPIAIFYEHPDWFKPLFLELEKRKVPFVALDAAKHCFSLADRGVPYSLVVNRASPSAYLRGRANTTFYTMDWVTQLEAAGVPVVNGSTPYGYEISKVRQLQLLQSLGISYPKSWATNSCELIPQLLSEKPNELRFPLVTKANIGGSGAGIVRFNSLDEVVGAVSRDEIPMGIDGVALIQEYARPAGGHIVRIEVLGGKFLYAIKVYPPEGSFDLCPADACQTTGGKELVRSACAVDAPKRGLRVEKAVPLPEMVAAAERIAQAAQLDVGGIEYLVDDRDNKAYVYDINALSNFVADAKNVIGFDPFVNLVDYLVERAQQGR
jgi:glutathione synthase/RimK-type ligase-like ATP-grasp enzyme